MVRVHTSSESDNALQRYGHLKCFKVCEWALRSVGHWSLVFLLVTLYICSSLRYINAVSLLSLLLLLFRYVSNLVRKSKKTSSNLYFLFYTILECNLYLVFQLQF